MAVTTIRSWAAEKTSGERVDEEVLVEEVGEGRWRLIASPGLAQGIAADDVIELDEAGRAWPVSRGGNLAIHIFAPAEHGDDLLPRMSALGGRRDGQTPSLTVYTVPVTAGFPAVEAILTDFVRSHPSAEWYYGNVYDDDGVTPLLWWETDKID